MTDLEDQKMETLNMSGSYKFSLYFPCPCQSNNPMCSHHHCRQSSDTSWGRPGEGKVEQQWGRKDRRGDRQVHERQVQERQVHERHETQVQDLRVQLQGGQRTVVDQVEGSEVPVPDLRSKLSQRRGEGNKDLREDLNSRRAGGGEEGDERPLSPRDQQRRAAAEERERLRNRARGGGGGQQRGGSGGQQRGGNQHQQQGRGGQHHGGRQNGREHEGGPRVQVNNQQHQNGVHEPQQQHGKQGGGKQIPRPKKNTENFNPSHEAPPMR